MVGDGRALRPERWELSRIDDLPISLTGVSALLSKKKKKERKKASIVRGVACTPAEGFVRSNITN